ncbi:helix-turn-helix domain-containing protein [Lysinibacillus xylanilyticus]|uniref:helix-turn-helix domain-containing protein n=1 Tax=Lysinibacillus xylanilyticus TaxID=582475 RepID=UPI00380B490A
MISTFGKNLKKIRTQKGVSLSEIASGSGVGEALLNSIEIGEKRPPLSYPIVLLIADILEVNVKELIDIKQN